MTVELARGHEGARAEAKVEEWARRWWGEMVEVAADRLSDRESAEDMAQQAMVKGQDCGWCHTHRVYGIHYHSFDVPLAHTHRCDNRGGHEKG